MKEKKTQTASFESWLHCEANQIWPVLNQLNWKHRRPAQRLAVHFWSLFKILMRNFQLTFLGFLTVKLIRRCESNFNIFLLFLPVDSEDFFANWTNYFHLTVSWKGTSDNKLITYDFVIYFEESVLCNCVLCLRIFAPLIHSFIHSSISLINWTTEWRTMEGNSAPIYDVIRHHTLCNKIYFIRRYFSFCTFCTLN